MRRYWAASVICLCFQSLTAIAQDAGQPVVGEPARAGVLVTITGSGELVLAPTDTIELENGLQLQKNSFGRWVVGGTVISLRELTSNPFTYNGRTVTVTGGSVANVLPEYGFFQYSNFVDGGTITVLTEGLAEQALAPYVAACGAFLTRDAPECAVSITGTVNVNEADNAVELTDPVFVTD